MIQCDFSTLLVGVSLEEAAQAERLREDCLMNVTAIRTIDDNVPNIFDSSNIKGKNARFDPDLGVNIFYRMFNHFSEKPISILTYLSSLFRQAPNKACPGGGPGRGKGGRPEAPYPNCSPQGNVMIIQNENMSPSVPNDSAYGGCLVFDFEQSVDVSNLALLDIGTTVLAMCMVYLSRLSSLISPLSLHLQLFSDEPNTANITVRCVTVYRSTLETGEMTHFLTCIRFFALCLQATKSSGEELPTLFSPIVGDNGFWIANSTMDFGSFTNIAKLVVCFPGSGAVSFIHYQVCD